MSRYRLAPSPAQEKTLRDHTQAMANYFSGTHRKPRWPKAGRDEGFRIVVVRLGHVRRLSRNNGTLWVPKAGWVRFRWTRAVPRSKSYRITLDRAGRWHVAFAAIPKPIPGRESGAVVGIDRGVAVSAALSTGELLRVPRLSPQLRRRMTLLQRKLARAKRGSSRRARVRLALARLRAREAGFACNADLSAAMNIAAGHAVTARGRSPAGGRTNREPQLALLSA